MRDAVAELEIEPRQQRGIGRRAERAVTLGQQFVDRHWRLQRQFAEHRVGAIDRLELDQRQPAVGCARHGAQRRRHRQRPAGAQKRDLIGLGFALDQGEGDIAAKQRAAFARQSFAEAGCDGAYARDRHHAERDAGDEDVEAAQAPAQFAKRKPQRKRMSRGRRERVRNPGCREWVRRQRS